MTPNNAPHNALRHHVSGAVRRGEAEPVVAVVSAAPMAPVGPVHHRTPVTLVLASWWVGRAAAEGDAVASWLVHGGPVPPYFTATVLPRGGLCNTRPAAVAS